LVSIGPASALLVCGDVQLLDMGGDIVGRHAHIAQEARVELFKIVDGAPLAAIIGPTAP
jgi:hypothetical protein